MPLAAGDTGWPSSNTADELERRRSPACTHHLRAAPSLVPEAAASPVGICRQRSSALESVHRGIAPNPDASALFPTPAAPQGLPARPFCADNPAPSFALSATCDKTVARLSFPFLAAAAPYFLLEPVLRRVTPPTDTVLACRTLTFRPGRARRSIRPPLQVLPHDV